MHVLRLGPSARSDALEWLLETANSIVTYRARYRRAPELLPVMHLVVFDETNPHSVHFQVVELVSLLARTATELGQHGPTPSSEELAALAEAWREAPLEGFDHDAGEELEHACFALARLLARAERASLAMSDELQRRFFTHAATPAPLGIDDPSIRRGP